MKKGDVEFSLTIKRASQDQQSGEMRWYADTSDTGDDLANDNMTKELFKDFVSRIQAGQLAPQEFQSEFWKGGMPYLSISHYDDLGGKAVPGMPTDVYVDGKFLKAKGKFYDTPLGRSAWKSVKAALDDPSIQPVQISIGFLDYGHTHKSNGFKFERRSIDETCPECQRERMIGEYKGRSFTKGQLVHLALTRVPMNQRTSIFSEKTEVDDMTTRNEDAASIIGDELASEIEKESQAVNKALVVKSDVDQLAEVVKSLTTQISELKAEVEKMKDAKGKEHAMPMDDEEDEYEDEEKKKMKSQAELVETLKAAFTPLFADLNQKLGIVSTALAEVKSAATEVPVRRAVTSVPNPDQPKQLGTANPGSTKFSDVARRSVGLE